MKATSTLSGGDYRIAWLSHYKHFVVKIKANQFLALVGRDHIQEVLSRGEIQELIDTCQGFLDNSPATTVTNTTPIVPVNTTPSTPNVVDLEHLKDQGYDVTIKPSDSSAGVLDQDEMARVFAGGLTMLAGGLMILASLYGNIGDRAEMVLGAGIPMIPAGAALVAGPGKKS